MTIYYTNLQNALSHALYLIRKCSLWRARITLLVINSNLGHISHCFKDTATYWLKMANFPYPPHFSRYSIILPYYQQQKWSPTGTLYTVMQTHVGVPWWGGLERWAGRTNFFVISFAISLEPLELKSWLGYRIISAWTLLYGSILLCGYLWRFFRKDTLIYTVGVILADSQNLTRPVPCRFSKKNPTRKL